MFRHLARIACVLVTIGLDVGPVVAGELTGTIDLLVKPDGPAPRSRGFLKPGENATLPVKPYDPKPYLVVVAVPRSPGTAPSPTTTTWDVVGDSFGKPLLPVRLGAEVNIRNQSKRVVSLTSQEDPTLIPPGPISPKGSRPFTVKTAGIHHISDPGIPHLRGLLVAFESPYFTVPNDQSAFVFKELPPGEYDVKLWYRDGWHEEPGERATIPVKGSTIVKLKVTSWKVGAK